MTQATTAIAKPVPEPDEHSAPFFEGAANGRLVIRHCNASDTFLAPASKVCSECLGEDVEWRAVSGRGTLHTFGVMHQRYHPGFDAEIPYNIAVVELEEGPRLQSNIVGCPTDQLRVGMALVATFERVGEGIFLPKFTPAVEAR